MNIQHLSTHLIYVKHHMLKSTDPIFFGRPKTQATPNNPESSNPWTVDVEASRFGKGWEEWGESGRDPMDGRGLFFNS